MNPVRSRGSSIVVYTPHMFLPVVYIKTIILKSEAQASYF